MGDKFNQPPPNAIFNAEVRYEFNREQLYEILRNHCHLPDGIVDMDISSKGQFRSISIRVKRTEIQG